MKKITTYLTMIALLSGASLSAQQTGAGASSSSYTGLNNNWQNWVFAGSALLTASVAVFVVSMGNGQSTGQSH
jgi:hypothetical protein